MERAVISIFKQHNHHDFQIYTCISRDLIIINISAAGWLLYTIPGGLTKSGFVNKPCLFPRLEYSVNHLSKRYRLSF